MSGGFIYKKEAHDALDHQTDYSYMCPMCDHPILLVWLAETVMCGNCGVDLKLTLDNKYGFSTIWVGYYAPM